MFGGEEVGREFVAAACNRLARLLPVPALERSLGLANGFAGSAIGRSCVKTASPQRSLATTSSGLWLFRNVTVPLRPRSDASERAISMGVNQISAVDQGAAVRRGRVGRDRLPS